MSQKAFQDYYPDEYSHCFGCGRLNDHGLQIKSYWEGDEAIAHHLPPNSYHTAMPGFVYGGLIASLIDCHCIATASAAVYQAEGREMGSKPVLRFVTASIKVDYLKPTPMDVELEIRAQAIEVKSHKVVVRARLLAAGEVCAKGEVVAVLLPKEMMA